jgi:hypothetical protein
VRPGSREQAALLIAGQAPNPLRLRVRVHRDGDHAFPLEWRVFHEAFADGPREDVPQPGE